MDIFFYSVIFLFGVAVWTPFAVNFVAAACNHIEPKLRKMVNPNHVESTPSPEASRGDAIIRGVVAAICVVVFCFIAGMVTDGKVPAWFIFSVVYLGAPLVRMLKVPGYMLLIIPQLGYKSYSAAGTALQISQRKRLPPPAEYTCTHDYRQITVVLEDGKPHLVKENGEYQEMTRVEK